MFHNSSRPELHIWPSLLRRSGWENGSFEFGNSELGVAAFRIGQYLPCHGISRFIAFATHFGMVADLALLIGLFILNAPAPT
jgi:hypothetical protein